LGIRTVTKAVHSNHIEIVASAGNQARKVFVVIPNNSFTSAVATSTCLLIVEDVVVYELISVSSSKVKPERCGSNISEGDFSGGVSWHGNCCSFSAERGGG